MKATIVSRRAALLLAGGAVGLAALTGCSVSVGGGYDQAKLEGNLSEALSTEEGKVTVACPAEASLEAGTTFTCTATAPTGEEATVLVTANGEGEDVAWEIQQPAQ